MIRLGLAVFGVFAAYLIASPVLHQAAALITQTTELIP